MSAQVKTESSTRKKWKKPVVILIGIIGLAWLLFGGKSAEKTAKNFVESMLDGDAKKCVSLLTDDAVEQTGSATRKILINTMDDALEGLVEEYKDKYGNSWKYKVTAIDSYEYTYEYYNGGYIGDAVKVVVEIQHKGGGLFDDEEGEETETLVLVKEGRKWLVAGFAF